jgi:hypothetical protein
VSYARFAEDSNVYVFASVGGWIECCWCCLGGPERYDTTQEMLDHLAEHVIAGHLVPDYCTERLRHDAEENDAWIIDERTRVARADA